MNYELSAPAGADFSGSGNLPPFRLSGLRTRQHTKIYPLVLIGREKEIPIR